MAPRSRGIDRIISTAISTRTSRSVCRSCRQTIAQRGYASTATAQAIAEAPPVSQLTPDQPQVGTANETTCTVKAGVLLSRAPLITADPHPFERAYHLYQRRLNERLVLPFTQYFYYKRGTPAFEQWRKHKTTRGDTATRDIGQYNAYKEDSWNDEVLVGDETADSKKLVEQLVDEEGRGAEFAGGSGLDSTAGLRRRTEADTNNDTRSLERSLDRTLYLLVREKAKPGKHENWVFPNGVLAAKEGIAEAASRVLNETCGVHMNTWQVAKHPVGYYSLEHGKSEAAVGDQPASTDQGSSVQDTSPTMGEKTFFIKTRIFAGQADVAQEVRTYEDFAWLAREEIEAKVHPRYWTRVKNMLAEQ